MTTDYLFGINAIHETLIAAPRSVREIFVSENSNHGRLQALVDEARRQGLPVGYRAARDLSQSLKLTPTRRLKNYCNGSLMQSYQDGS